MLDIKIKIRTQKKAAGSDPAVILCGGCLSYKIVRTSSLF
jgi:hypothetical protein|nr:MAG: hypothetical protein [Bacteriophage sp.]